MLKNHLEWFFVIFNREFRQTKTEAFEMFMFLAIAHFFGCCNPKQLADYLGVGHQGLYRHLKDLSLYTVKRLLVKFMVRQAAEKLKPVLEKSAATRSRAGIAISVDNSVIDRFGRMLRFTWSWYSGRWKKVVNGHDLLGIVMSIGGIPIPLSLVFCSKQGRGSTDKPSLLISMLTLLTEEFKAEGIDITAFPITMDSWFASERLKQQLHALGFKKIIIAGKGNYTFYIDGEKKKASEWKGAIEFETGGWGIDADVPFRRVEAFSPTFGRVALYFFRKSSTRSFYLMDFSKTFMRGAEAWHIWKQHHIIEFFWKILKSVLGIKAMRLHDNPHAALLVKIIAYLLAVRLRGEKAYAGMSVTQIMRKIRRGCDLEALLREFFHLQL
jgi:hypothetical protein